MGSVRRLTKMGVKNTTGSAWDWCDSGFSVTQVTAVGWCEPGSVPGSSHQLWRRDHSFWADGAGSKETKAERIHKLGPGPVSEMRVD